MKLKFCFPREDLAEDDAELWFYQYGYLYVKAPKIRKIKKIAVTLSDLAIESMQISLFDSKNNPKENKVSKVLDKINEKFEKNAISLGLVKLKKKEETPIAFGYIPDKK